MTERERIKRIVAEIGWDCVVAGSGVMVMHGMDRELGDVDLFVSTRDWFNMYWDIDLYWKVFTTDPSDPKRRHDPPYLYCKMYGIEVNVFFCWRIRDKGNLDLNKAWQESEIIDGVRCSSLKDLCDWKREVARDKDAEDIRMIEEYLTATQGVTSK